MEEISEGNRTRFRVFFNSRRSIRDLKKSFASFLLDFPNAGFRIERLSVDPDGWITKFKEAFRGFAVGSTFYVHPPWEEPSGRHPLNLCIKPGQAFGTGTHESTQLCLRALESLIPDHSRLLDVGTGSGILAVASRKLSSGMEIVAMDSDPEATAEAMRNFRRNGVEDIPLFTGKLEAIRGSFDLVVANLTLGIFRQEAAELVRLTQKTLIVSGFTRDQEILVWDQFGLSVLESWSENGWCCHQLCP